MIHIQIDIFIYLVYLDLNVELHKIINRTLAIMGPQRCHSVIEG